jgi:hypothetical protein
MKRALLLFALAACSSKSSSPTAPPPAPTPTETGSGSSAGSGSAAPTDSIADGPGMGKACGDNDACAKGFECVKYYGIAGARGPQFKTCEIRCEKTNEETVCPKGTHCTTVADGPGQVCR